MQDRIKSEIKESIDIHNLVGQRLAPQIEQAAKKLIEALKKGNKVLVFGNGGSAADAQHMAAELVGRYKKDRKALPAIALTTDTSILTAVANDFGFENVFVKQIEGLAHKGDIALGISTSGNSVNVLEAIEKAKQIGCKTIGLLGCDGGRIAKVADISITVPSNDTPRIQESQGTIIHILCSLIEQELFPS
jgi:D-sedoheptulose 7-phosphate isomerase